MEKYKDYIGRKIKLGHPSGKIFNCKVACFELGVGCTLVMEDDPKKIVCCTDLSMFKNAKIGIDKYLKSVMDCIDEGAVFDIIDIEVKLGEMTAQQAKAIREEIALKAIFGEGVGISAKEIKDKCVFG